MKKSANALEFSGMRSGLMTLFGLTTAFARQISTHHGLYKNNGVCSYVVAVPWP